MNRTWKNYVKNTKWSVPKSTGGEEVITAKDVNRLMMNALTLSVGAICSIVLLLFFSPKWNSKHRWHMKFSTRIRSMIPTSANSDAFAGVSTLSSTLRSPPINHNTKPSFENGVDTDTEETITKATSQKITKAPCLLTDRIKKKQQTDNGSPLPHQKAPPHRHPPMHCSLRRASLQANQRWHTPPPNWTILSLLLFPSNPTSFGHTHNKQTVEELRQRHAEQTPTTYPYLHAHPLNPQPLFRTLPFSSYEVKGQRGGRVGFRFLLPKSNPLPALFLQPLFV